MNRSKSTLKIILISVCLYPFSALPTHAMVLRKFDRPVADVFHDIAKFLLSLAGGIALFVVILGGIYFMISSGNPESRTNAKNMIRYALLGLVIVLISYALLVAIESFSV